MQCTPAEIEEKRRQAKLKLAQKSVVKSINETSVQQLHPGLKHNTPHKPPNNLNIYGSPVEKQPNSLNNAKQNLWRSPNSTKYSNKPYEKPVQPLQTSSFYGNGKVITGTCYLISDDRFAVETSEFSTAAINVFKTMPSRAYNSKTKLWDFNIKDYDTLQSKLQRLQPDVVIGKLPTFVLNCFQIPKTDYATIDLSKVDEELLSALMPFQQEGVCFGIDKNGRCLIADDMGLGKTFQALAIASYYKEDWPLLVVTTSSMKNVWEATIHKYLPSISVLHTRYMVTAKDHITDAKILIVSHDMMSRCVDKLSRSNFGVLIVDESHNFKNFKAKCTKAAIEIAKKAKRIILLSGTPALSRPSELYTQLSILDEKFFGNFFDYSKRYCNGRTTHFGWDASGKSNLQELEVILAKKFMIRRTKDDVLKSLPNKTQEVVMLDVNLQQFNEEERRCLKALALNYNQKRSHDKHAALLSFFSETAKIKIPSVCSYILQTLEQNIKFIVFAHHKKMLDAIEQILVKKKKKFIRIDGNTSSDKRKFFVDKFQVDYTYECALLSITAANAGITLTAAQLVLFAELHWNPSILSQAESRAHRIGQEGKVVVKYLLAPGTADDSIWPLLQNKQKILQEAGLCKDSFDNVAVNKQDLSNTESITECLGSSFTVANTLDISSFFQTPDKKVENKNFQSAQSEISFSGFDMDESSFNVTDEKMDFLLNDEFDEVLSNVPDF